MNEDKEKQIKSSIAEHTNQTETPSAKVLNIPKKLILYRSWRFWAVMIGFVFALFAVIKVTDVVMVYREAIVFKKAYDLVQNEKLYCEQIQGTSQPRDNFVYCDKFRERFKEVEKK